jgi:hypothetical protein
VPRASLCKNDTLYLKHVLERLQRFFTFQGKEADSGALGGEYLQVAHETDEVLVCNGLICAIKEVF